MAYIVGTDRYQTRMVTTSLDDLISKDNSVRVIDSYVESLNLENLGFIEYSGRNRGQSPYRRSDLLKLHIYGYLNKIRSSRALETEAKRNLELMWLINCITPDHGTIAGFVQKNKAAFLCSASVIALYLSLTISLSPSFSDIPLFDTSSFFIRYILKFSAGCLMPFQFFKECRFFLFYFRQRFIRHIK